MATLRWLLTIGFLLVASAAVAEPAYYKITADDLAEAAAKPAAFGTKFDANVVMSVRPQGMIGLLHGSRYPMIGFVDLTALSETNRTKVFDDCSPTPCRARAKLTLLPKPRNNWPVFQLDSWD